MLLIGRNLSAPPTSPGLSVLDYELRESESGDVHFYSFGVGSWASLRPLLLNLGHARSSWAASSSSPAEVTYSANCALDADRLATSPRRIR